MLPTSDQIERAAYFRWVRRGHEHGRDREDWLAAEEELRFLLNYEVVAHVLLDADAPRTIGNAARPVCRFCERTAPAATFAPGRLALPGFLGNRSLFTVEECDECHAEFLGGIEAELERFLTALRSSPRRPPEAIGLPAFKGLVKQALALVPRSDLHLVEDATEWVGNTDHDFDARLFQGLGCQVRRLPDPGPGPESHPWAALARRVDDEAMLPFLLFFLGMPGLLVQLALPGCVRDEDLEGHGISIPDVTLAPGSAVETLAFDFAHPRRFLPVATPPARPARRFRLDALLLDPASRKGVRNL